MVIGKEKIMIKESEPIQLLISKKWMAYEVEELAKKVELTKKGDFTDKLNYFKYFAFEK